MMSTKSFFAYYFLKVHLRHHNSRNQCFSFYFCWMIEGSGRPKNIWILQIRIRLVGYRYICSGSAFPIRIRTKASQITAGSGSATVIRIDNCVWLLCEVGPATPPPMMWTSQSSSVRSAAASPTVSSLSFPRSGHPFFMLLFSSVGDPWHFGVDPDPDPSIFIIDLQDANKKLI